MLRNLSDSSKYAQKGRRVAPLPSVCNLLTDAQLSDDRTVSVDVLLLQVSQQISSAADHLQHTSSGVMILLVYLQVLSQIIDSTCQDRDLHLRRTGIGLMIAVINDDSCLFFLTQHFCFTSLK